MGEETRHQATEDLAGLLRVPVTILGDTLRRASSGRALPPSQGQALSQLSAEESLTVSQLAQAQEVAVSSMTETVQRLEAKGLITKTGAEQDRRQVRVAITAEGRYRLKETVHARDELLRGRLERLASEDLERLAAAAPVLWRLARLDSGIWPRIPSRPRRPRSRESQSHENPPRGTY
ncbi:MarR family winged helix-turn-helix transcriptional regulator [Arthrobacter sp. MMS18-M83]|uniref:MarR family winged helix-turn-helix transcriptional regulator n=1 Tax=Arthrobacter sp. MMS18-M83 TaxID=2996261 RepID=UPI00227A0A24|nr:MarR family transcriptional regulator [Arthrobacter sp. MMS18-M83]WAH96318.1 MarR family transcriptional regulator [Arthrobacter sp. MMS18-M83]